MDLNARVDLNCGQNDGWTENRTPIPHLAKAGVTKKGEAFAMQKFLIFFFQ